MSNTHAHMHIVNSFLIKPCLFISPNFRLQTPCLIGVLVILKIWCSSLNLTSLSKTRLLLDWEVARFCLPFPPIFFFVVILHLKGPPIGLGEERVSASCLFGILMPFSWENCLRDEERAAPLAPFPLPLGCIGGDRDKESEKDPRVIHVWELLYKTFDFSVI